MSARGFVLLEWLVAAALIMSVAGAVFAIAVPTRDVIERTQHRLDLVNAAQSAFQQIAADVREAGSPAGIADVDMSVEDWFPSIVLLKDLASGDPGQPATAMTLRQTPMSAAQGLLAAPVPAGQSLLPLDTGTRCWSGPPACGFEEGDRAVLSMAGAAEPVVITAIAPGSVTLTAGITSAFPKGAVLSRFTETTYAWLSKDNDLLQLVRLTDGGAKQPMLDHVVHFSVVADVAEPMSARRLAIRLRVQTNATQHRGPAGYLFAEPGTAAGPRHWLPDVELRADVALRQRARVP